MLSNKYGLTFDEEVLIKFLEEKEIDFAPLFYNSAIPIKELFYFFVIAGETFREFSRIPDLFSELEKFNVIESTLKLRKICESETVGLKLSQGNMPNCKELLAQRLFKPEQYIPFYFVESDIDNIENLCSKMNNMFYAYKVMRYRMLKYYSAFIDVEFMRKPMEKVEYLYKLSLQLKNKNVNKCFALLCELNKEDVLIMNTLKTKLREIK